MRYNDLKTMTDAEKNTLIAIAIGGVFKICECGLCNGYKRWHWRSNANPWNHDWQTEEKRPDVTDEIPNFIHDLNAMHEAEKTMDAATYLVYTNVRLPQVMDFHAEHIIIATPAQRANAFILATHKDNLAIHKSDLLVLVYPGDRDIVWYEVETISGGVAELINLSNGECRTWDIPTIYKYIETNRMFKHDPAKVLDHPLDT